MDVETPPPHPNGLMKWAPGGLKKNSRAGEKNSPSPKNRQKKLSGSLKSSCPPPKKNKIKWLFPKHYKPKVGRTQAKLNNLTTEMRDYYTNAYLHKT